MQIAPFGLNYSVNIGPKGSYHDHIYDGTILSVYIKRLVLGDSSLSSRNH